MLLLTISHLLQLLLLLSAIAAIHVTVKISKNSSHANDMRTLLAFKAKISNHSGVLTSWNQSTSYCNWEGVTCSRRHQWRVVAQNLTSQGLAGVISPAIGNLSHLRSLNLSLNDLQGEIPPSIGSFDRLQSLDLTENMLTGGIPRNISRCTRLRVMDIGSNSGLQGTIPAEIGNMPSLAIIQLYSNNITGTIPSSFGNLSRLHVLSLANNNLEGSIPAGLGNVRLGYP